MLPYTKLYVQFVHRSSCSKTSRTTAEIYIENIALNSKHKTHLHIIEANKILLKIHDSQQCIINKPYQI